MIKTTALRRRASTLASIAALLVASIAPAMLGTQQASAAQLTERKITISSSKVSQTGVSYATSFKATQTTLIKGIVVQFCQDSPLIGQTCDNTNGVSATPTTGTVSVTNAGAVGSPFTFNVDATSGGGLLKLTNATGFTPVTSAPITFSFTGTNPSVNGTFYARILTYTSDTDAAAYTATIPGIHLDDGGIALSTANQLTINARVQEQLQFCVGTVALPATAPADCSGLTGTTVDLGVVDSAAVSVSPVAATNGGNNLTGAAMVRTNAANGVVIDYFAEQAASGTEHLGALRVAGAPCAADAVPSIATGDQCFNSAGTAITAFTAGNEKFGLTISEVDRTGSTTTNLNEDAAYNGDGLPATGFAWDETGAFDRLASSATGVNPENRVIDDEMLELRFAATAAVTTPTGSYAVTSTYVATATF